MKRRSPPGCSFCGKTEADGVRLIAGEARPGTFICEQCIEVAVDITSEQPTTSESTEGLATIGVRELRNQVAAVVRRAAAGERIVVTVDGRPTAQLGPLQAAGAPGLADLAAAGLVEPPRTSRPAAAPSPEDLAVDVRLDRVLDELRGR